MTRKKRNREGKENEIHFHSSDFLRNQDSFSPLPVIRLLNGFLLSFRHSDTNTSTFSPSHPVCQVIPFDLANNGYWVTWERNEHHYWEKKVSRRLGRLPLSHTLLSWCISWLKFSNGNWKEKRVSSRSLFMDNFSLHHWKLPPSLSSLPFTVERNEGNRMRTGEEYMNDREAVTPKTSVKGLLKSIRPWGLFQQKEEEDNRERRSTIVWNHKLYQEIEKNSHHANHFDAYF